MKRSSKLLLLLLCSCMAMAPAISTAAFAAGDDAGGTTKTFLVSDATGFTDAIKEINAAESGDFVIDMQQDIVVSDPTEFTKNTVTILGNGNTLTTNSGLGCNGTAVLNLGRESYTGGLIIKNGYYSSAVYATGTAKLNMHKVIIIGTNGTTGSAGGVQLNGSAIFTMYDGEINNGKDSFGVVAGGVLVADNAVFYMKGGTIQDCTLGVFAQNNGTFHMDDGTIKNCNRNGNGGGVYISSNAAFEMSGGKIIGCSSSNYGGGLITLSHNNILSGGEISGNSAKIGGGIFLQGSASISDTVRIYDNEASSGADDIYFTAGDGTKGRSLTLGQVPADLILTASGQKIDGWYVDSPRWTLGNEITAPHIVKYTPSNPITTTVALKAAHGIGYPVRVAVDSEGGSASPETQTITSGKDATIIVIRDPGYKVSAITVNGQPADLSALVDGNIFNVANIIEDTDVIVAFEKMTAKDIQDAAQALPAPPAEGEAFTDTEKNTILDTKMDYEALTDEEKGQVSAEDKHKLNEALSKLPSVEVKADLVDISDGTVSAQSLIPLLENMTQNEADVLKAGDITKYEIILSIEKANPGEQENGSISAALHGTIAGQYNGTVTKVITPADGSKQIVEIISELKQPVELIFHIPEDLRTVPAGTTRTFSMLRTHWDGNTYVTETLPDLDKEPATYTTSSNRFSIYTLVYQDKVDQSEPTETPKPGGPIDPTEPTETPEPGGPTDPTEPTETPKPDGPTDPTEPTNPAKPSPQTGDNSNIVLWFVLSLVSCGCVIGTILYRKKRKANG